jgi:PAS domain S-box-containing protein
MAAKPSPTQREIILDENDFIVSKTDRKGKITYCNEIFIRISGYEEDELLDQPHNIVRHPNMPRSVYRYLWNTLQAEKEFFGLVKNLCKNGDYYWTFANVTPSYNVDHEVIGYYSVRRKPNPDFVKMIEAVYAQMIAEEAKHESAQTAMDASFRILMSLIEQEGVSYDEFLYTHAT